MKNRAHWFFALALLALAWSACTAFAEEAALVLVDGEGEEVLHLEADQMTTGVQQIPAGRYLLKVEGPGVYKIDLLNDVEIEVKSNEDASEETASGEVEFSPVLIDFDLGPGDQHLREGLLVEGSEEIELQLVGVGLPQLYGWSATIKYDPDQVSYVENSFRPGDFLSGIMPMVDARDGSVEVGGANLSKIVAGGDGDLGYLSFEALDGSEGKAELIVTALKFRQLASINALDVEGRAIFWLADGRPNSESEEEDADEGPIDASGEEALSLLMNENACPGCDLSEADLKQANLRGANLRGARLHGANLFHADLEKADLEEANLTEANLLQAKLQDANLKEADLSGARLIGASLQGADLTDADLTDAKMNGAQLDGAIWIDGRECGRGSVGSCK